MRIIDIREKTASISSPIANAYVDFSKMTCSVVALITDVVRDGKPVVGYGFNSNGRYGQGALMRERFIPRLIEADSRTLIDAENDILSDDALAALLKGKGFDVARRTVVKYREAMGIGSSIQRRRQRKIAG